MFWRKHKQGKVAPQKRVVPLSVGESSKTLYPLTVGETDVIPVTLDSTPPIQWDDYKTDCNDSVRTDYPSDHVSVCEPVHVEPSSYSEPGHSDYSSSYDSGSSSSYSSSSYDSGSSSSSSYD